MQNIFGEGLNLGEEHHTQKPEPRYAQYGKPYIALGHRHFHNSPSFLRQVPVDLHISLRRWCGRHVPSGYITQHRKTDHHKGDEVLAVTCSDKERAKQHAQQNRNGCTAFNHAIAAQQFILGQMLWQN